MQFQYQPNVLALERCTWLIGLANRVVLSGLDVNGEALHVGLLRGGARERHAREEQPAT